MEYIFKKYKCTDPHSKHNGKEYILPIRLEIKKPFEHVVFNDEILSRYQLGQIISLEEARQIYRQIYFTHASGIGPLDKESIQPKMFPIQRLMDMALSLITQKDKYCYFILQRIIPTPSTKHYLFIKLPPEVPFFTP